MEPTPVQQISIFMVMRKAFFYLKRTFIYQILMSLLYFSVMFLVIYFVGARLGIFDQYAKVAAQLKVSPEAYSSSVQNLAKTPAFETFYWVFTGAQVFLYPLNFGLFKIYRKLDLNEKPNVQDLFAGYLGSRFFVYASFFLFWLMIYNLFLSTIFLAVIWVLITLFCAPLLFFMNKRIFEGISLTVKALKRYPVPILACVFTAVAVRYAGMLSIGLALFTFPVWTVIVYALYREIFNEKF